MPVLFAVAIESTGTGFWTVSPIEPETVGAATLTAEIVTGFVLGIVVGGVYSPLPLMVPLVLLPPVTPLTCHVTPIFVEFATTAYSWAVDPSRTWVGPVTVTCTCGACVAAVLELAAPPHPAIAKMPSDVVVTNPARTYVRRIHVPFTSNGKILWPLVAVSSTFGAPGREVLE